MAHLSWPPLHGYIGIEHHAVNASSGQHAQKAWHINNVNGFHSRLKT